MLYHIYTALIGHSHRLNEIRNRYSEHDVSIHSSAQIGRRTEFYGDIDIGRNVSIAWHSSINGSVEINTGTNLNGRNKLIGDISINKYCAIAPRVRIRTTAHPTHHPTVQTGLYDELGVKMESNGIRGTAEIGNDVWICADAKILSNVSIGDGAIIAANSVVVDDVEPYSFVAGNPAEHKKYRFDKSTRESLCEVEWWNWSIEKMRRNKKFFKSDLRDINDICSIIRE